MQSSWEIHGKLVGLEDGEGLGIVDMLGEGVPVPVDLHLPKNTQNTTICLTIC